MKGFNLFKGVLISMLALNIGIASAQEADRLSNGVITFVGRIVAEGCRLDFTAVDSAGGAQSIVGIATPQINLPTVTASSISAMNTLYAPVMVGVNLTECDSSLESARITFIAPGSNVNANGYYSNSIQTGGARGVLMALTDAGGSTIYRMNETISSPEFGARIDPALSRATFRFGVGYIRESAATAVQAGEFSSKVAFALVYN